VTPTNLRAIWMKPRKLVAPSSQAIKLDAIRANAGIEAKYRKALQALIEEMSRSVIYWTRAAWKKSPPLMATDGIHMPFVDLRRTMERLGRHWQRRFDETADQLADVFVNGATQHTDAAMMAALKRAGFTIKFQMTQAAKESYQAVLQENIALIKSIPAEYLHDVQTAVWQSVKSGHDLGTLTDALRSKYAVSFKRAALISRDQNNKAKAVIENVRRQELGITTAIWQHSGGGKEPRPSHVEASGKSFELAKGMYLDGEWLLPGQAINCRCTSRAVIPGFED